MADFVEICKVCTRKAIIEAAKRIINSDKVCHSYSDLNFGVTFLEHGVYNLDAVPPIHVVSNNMDTDKLTTANGGTFTSSSASCSSQSR